MILPVPATEAELTRHYAAVRARLVPSPPRVRPQQPKLIWTLPILVEDISGQTIEQRVTRILLGCRRYGARVKTRTIVDQTAQAFGVTLDDIYRHSQRRIYAVPRLVAMAVARHVLKDTKRGTVVELGRAFKRDHTCIINARERYGVLVERIASEIDQ